MTCEQTLPKEITQQIFKTNPKTVFRINDKIILEGIGYLDLKEPIFKIEVLE
jgi:hypothetical protein